ncbi:hypothetical protein [Rugamonas apoptosis]|uniref:Uncharacterized protein n=1 Tax=Rugamonas apoptosis TaxID=2758570 RepID=A0A7W2FF22_9BURK|nr:hypothetical protein [Rugamonas apoptosis]MBA5690503.1 hypothetical protein [Rugamonas apoptosis]
MLAPTRPVASNNIKTVRLHIFFSPMETGAPKGTLALLLKLNCAAAKAGRCSFQYSSRWLNSEFIHYSTVRLSQQDQLVFTGTRPRVKHAALPRE